MKLDVICNKIAKERLENEARQKSNGQAKKDVDCFKA